MKITTHFFPPARFASPGARQFSHAFVRLTIPVENEQLDVIVFYSASGPLVCWLKCLTSSSEAKVVSNAPKNYFLLAEHGTSG